MSKQHDIRTVRSRQLKLNDAIVGSFCTAFLTDYTTTLRDATSYHKEMFNEEIQSIYFPVFTVYFTNKPSITSNGYRQTISLMNAHDLRIFRDRLDKQRTNNDKRKFRK